MIISANQPAFQALSCTNKLIKYCHLAQCFLRILPYGLLVALSSAGIFTYSEKESGQTALFSLSKKHTTVVRLHKIEIFSGEPLDRVPHAKTIHRIVLAPLLIFKSQGISQSADCDQGSAFGIRRLLKKAGENF